MIIMINILLFPIQKGAITYMEYLKEIFYYTFIYDERYLLFVSGFFTTLLLSVASFFTGTLFGIMLCTFKRSGNKILARIAHLITVLFINMPTMVLLLVFVYVVFGLLSTPLVVIAITALTMKTGSYICEILMTSLDAVDPGEIEAARSLAMTRYQTFFHILMPHIIYTGLELYKNQFIMNMQETAVVGYVALVDEWTRGTGVVAHYIYPECGPLSAQQ